MKIFCAIAFLILIFSCKEKTNRWDVEVEPLNSKLEIIDIRKDYYSEMPLPDFRKKYPFYLSDSTSDIVYNEQRKDPSEININNEITLQLKKINLTLELQQLFEYIQYYFPNFKAPKIYLTNSMFKKEIQYEPIFYEQKSNSVFIACDYFLGSGNKFYNNTEIRIDTYLQKDMNPQNILPKVSYAISESIIPFDKTKRTFLNYLIYYGKLMILQDAFLPNTADEFKIGYTAKEIEWCYTNEYNMWNYFIRNDYLYSDDQDLIQRFISPAPFSKFFTFDEDNKSVDLDSPGKAGVWLGWQIMRSYFASNKEKKLQEVLVNTDFQALFNDSKYKPEK